MGVELNIVQPDFGTKNQRLTRISNPKLARNIALFNPSIDDIELLIDIASQEIPNLASPDVVCNIFRHNPECFWGLAKSNGGKCAVDWAGGFFAILPLNEAGVEALVSGRLSTSNPNTKYVCRQWEVPAALYFWCIYAPGPLAAGISLWANHYYSPKYQGRPIYAKAGTASGAHFFERLGFQQGGIWNGVRNDSLISVTPPSPTPYDNRGSVTKTMPAYENYARSYGLTPPKDEISCSVAASLDDLMQAMAIRSVVYIGEQNCPYGEEWDGNDLSASHIIARIGDKPIGTIRLRCFKDFAKVERMCVHPAHRQSRTAFKLERACTELARALGYDRLIGHSHANILRFWLSRGWKELSERETFAFSDYECIQIEKPIVPHVDAINFETDPLTLIRPVGRWHVPGPLDASAVRPVVNAPAAQAHAA